MFCVLWKNDPLREKFQNSVPKGFIASPIDVLYSNFVKFGRREIGEIVRCLPEKNVASLSSSRCCADRTQNLPDNVLRVLQISSKSIHFRRSYIRTRERHQSARQSESNIWLTPIFEPNNDLFTSNFSLTYVYSDVVTPGQYHVYILLYRP